jgi:nitronate monooxygenase
MQTIRQRTDAFCGRFALKAPLLLAPMAGACPASLSIAVAQAGGLGACGVVMMKPDDIRAWVDEFRAATDAPFQLNTWVPDPPAARDAAHEGALRAFLSQRGPEVPADAGDAPPPDFEGQVHTMLELRPPAMSSVMGLYPPPVVAAMKAAGIAWLAGVTTVAEARAAEAAGADVIVAQGAEAGGHRGRFDAGRAEAEAVGLFALLPAVVDTVRVPVVATGGIADARGIAAALMLGASAVQIGTGFLRCPEAKLPPAWADALGRTLPEQTQLTRAFSGRAGRSIANDYVRAAAAPDAPAPAPYPVQRALTARMRAEAVKQGDVQRMQAWAGQSARLASAEPAGPLLQRLWAEAQTLLGAAAD